MMDFNAVSMMIGKLGTSEVILILVVLILLFGPKYLPKSWVRPLAIRSVVSKMVWA